MKHRGDEDRRMDALCWEIPRVMDEECVRNPSIPSLQQFGTSVEKITLLTRVSNGLEPHPRQGLVPPRPREIVNGEF